MVLETIIGTLLAGRRLKPDTFQHADQLTAERRDDWKLRKQRLYTADGQIYTVQGNDCFWGITRGPQNIVLQNIAEAYRQLTGQVGDYFPDTEAARSSLSHPDTEIINLRRFRLDKDNDFYGHFVIDPKKAKRLSSRKKQAVYRIFGPDEENLGLNMDMFAEAKIMPRVFLLTPKYVQHVLRKKKEEFLCRASSLADFDEHSDFSAHFCNVNYHQALCGERYLPDKTRRAEDYEHGGQGDAQKNNYTSPLLPGKSCS